MKSTKIARTDMILHNKYTINRYYAWIQKESFLTDNILISYTIYGTVEKGDHKYTYYSLKYVCTTYHYKSITTKSLIQKKYITVAFFQTLNSLSVQVCIILPILRLRTKPVLTSSFASILPCWSSASSSNHMFELWSHIDHRPRFQWQYSSVPVLQMFATSQHHCQWLNGWGEVMKQVLSTFWSARLLLAVWHYLYCNWLPRHQL